MNHLGKTPGFQWGVYFQSLVFCSVLYIVVFFLQYLFLMLLYYISHRISTPEYTFGNVETLHANNLLSQDKVIRQDLIGIMVRFMVFNVTFNNISIILWRSVLLVEETVKLYHIMF